MGYNTTFAGSFDITPKLTPEHRTYLAEFSRTRRMKRDPQLLQGAPDPAREAVGLPLGVQGEFYTGDTTQFGQDDTPDILDYNEPPRTQPELWCHWEPNTEGTTLQWNGAEKFYSYTQWLEYMIKMFFKPWGYSLSGSVRFSGEEPTDVGAIEISDNQVNTGSR